MLSARKMSESCIKSCPLQCQRHDFNINMEKLGVATHHYPAIEKLFGWTKNNRSKTMEYVQYVISLKLWEGI